MDRAGDEVFDIKHVCCPTMADSMAYTDYLVTRGAIVAVIHAPSLHEGGNTDVSAKRGGAVWSSPLSMCA